MPALTERLRGEIATTHDAIEHTPLAVAMQAGTLAPDEYRGLVRQLWHLHDGIEPACQRATRLFPALATVYDPERDRRDVLAADLVALGEPDPGRPHPDVVALCTAATSAALDTPWALAGVLYVLEGSRMGSTTLARTLAAGWGTVPAPGRGLDYHLHHLASRGSLWVSFRQALDALPLPPAWQDDVCASARHTMDHFLRLYADLRVAACAR